MTTSTRPISLAACAALALAGSGRIGTAHAQATATYTLSKVAFVGNAQVPSSELQAALPIQPGQTVDRDGLQQDTDAIAAVYRKHNVGANMTARMVVAKGKYATVTYTFVEQAPVAPTIVHVGITVDQVTASGNKKIKTADIVAASGIKPGETVTNSTIAAAQAAVLALYKKNNVGATINTDWTTPQPQHIDLVFTVVEK